MSNVTPLRRKYLKVPAESLQALRQAIQQDNVRQLDHIFKSLAARAKGVTIDTTPYCDIRGPNSLCVIYGLLMQFCRSVLRM